MIDEQTTGMAKRDAPRVPKKCQMREELYLKISWVGIRKEKYILVLFIIHFNRLIENYYEYLTKFYTRVFIIIRNLLHENMISSTFRCPFRNQMDKRLRKQYSYVYVYITSLFSCNVISLEHREKIYKYLQLSCQTYNTVIKYAYKIKYHR